MNHAVRPRHARTVRPELTCLEERNLPAVLADLSVAHALDSILVQFKTPAQAARFNPGAVLGDVTMSTEIAPLLNPGLRQISFTSTQYSVSQVLTVFAARPEVGFTQPNYIYTNLLTPNDPRFGELWGLHNTGQSGGTADKDIDAPEAWDMHVGDGNFVIADIDTGVDWDHPDLAANMWTNAGEVGGAAGVDDDGNGFIDDFRGWDFVNNDNNPTDDHGHGTHTSGTIGAVGNNGVGVTGVNWNVKIMPLKFLAASGSGSTAGAVGCLNYAVMMGCKVSNNSWGGGGFDNSLNNALTNARNQGHIFVAAAGNANNNNDVNPFYPASYPQNNIIAVAATDRNDARASFSSYGATSVDLGAPGVTILSTTPGTGYGNSSGTSMAAPHVAGAVALVWDLHPNLTYSEVISRILTTVDVIPSMQGRVVTNGRLNLQRALFNTAPVAVPNIYTTAEDSTLTVNAPGVLGNDTDADKDDLTAQLVSNTTNGTLVFNSNGSFTYTPNPDFFGTDSFTYVARDAKTSSTAATVTINVTPVNDAPVAVDDNYFVIPGGLLTITAPGVLVNDSDVDPGTTLRASLVAGPVQGVLVFNTDGSFDFTAPRRMTGPITFTYVANDGALDSNVATVTIRPGTGTPPTSEPDTYFLPWNAPFSDNVLTNDSDPDGDPLTAIKVTDPTNGALVFNSDGTFTYTPNAGFFGKDSFTYKTNDGVMDGATVEVALIVGAVPVANPDSYTVFPGQVLFVNPDGVLQNDVDPDAPKGSLMAELVTDAANGILALYPDGSLLYSPNAGFLGNDTFTYRTGDGTYWSNPATVTIQVGKPPQANPDNYTATGLPFNIPSSKGVLINDSGQSSPLTAHLRSGPTAGTLTLHPDGSFDFDAPVGFTGVVTFTYVANDGMFDSNEATVTITVPDVSGPPVATDNVYNLVMNRTLRIHAPGILANDSDPDGDPLIAILNQTTTNGILQFFNNGAFWYTPNFNFTGTDSFTYWASDGPNISNLATVTLNVSQFPTPTPTPTPSKRVVMAQEVGGRFKIFNGDTGQEFFGVTPFANFTGSVRIATADFSADGVPDVLAAAGPHTTPSGVGFRARVFDGNTGQLLPGILGFGVAPFGTNYTGGMHVAAGDVTGDGRADMIISADVDVDPTNPNAPLVAIRVYDGTNGLPLPNWLGGFTPYATPVGGVRVAVGDVNGDGRADIVTSPGGTQVPAVQAPVLIFNAAANGLTPPAPTSFSAYAGAIAGGIYVAAGDLDGDGQAEIITGAELNAEGHVRVFSGGGAHLRSLFVGSPTIGAVRVATGDINGDGKLDLVVGARTTGFGGSRGRVYDATTLQEMLINPGQLVYDGNYSDALFVAALNKV